MAIIETLNTQSQFAHRMMETEYKDNFSWAALYALFDYLDDSCENIEFDACAFACDFNELTVDDIIDQYNVEIEEGADNADKLEAVREYLEENTSVIAELEDGFLFYTF
jgi:hypothetical protein